MGGMPEHPYVLLDVFTDRPLTGNALAVFLDGPALPEELLLPVAREMNLAETVFLCPPRDGGTARARIFTTVEELPFAGHPTLGTACLLADRSADSDTSVRLETGRGIIPVDVVRVGDGHLTGEMDQPLPTVADWPEPGPLLASLGLATSLLPVQVYDNGIPHLYVRVASGAELFSIAPSAQELQRLTGGARVNCFAGEGAHWTTRMFSPYDRVFEDPATGSAAGPLAAHLVRHGAVPSGSRITIAQGAAVHRPSTLLARAEVLDGLPTRVRVGGSARIVGEGVLRL
jgi:trans-2,3-dihydro-3-hydroxyanthranilate isomerase